MEYFANRSLGALSAGITNSATSLTLNSGEGARFIDPATYGSFYAWIYDSSYGTPALDPNAECVLATAKSTNTFTITRAQKGTTAVAHNTAGKTYYFVAGPSAENFNNEICWKDGFTPNGGYQFDGTDDYVSVADNGNINFANGDSTMVIFFQKTIPATPEAIFAKYENTAQGEKGFEVLAYSNGRLRVRWHTGGTANEVYTTSSVLGANGLFIVGVKNPTNVQVYTNGILDNTANVVGISNNTNNPLYIGSRGGVDIISDQKFYLLRLFNRALTAAEVKAMYNNGMPHLYQLPFADRGASQTELITNGSFTGNANGWGLGTGWTYNLNNVIATNVNGGDAINQNATLTAGKNYKITLEITITNGYAKILCGNGDLGQTILSSGTYTYSRTCAGNSYFYLQGYENFNGTVDNVSIIQIGCVAEYLPQNAGRLGWIESSGNQLSGATSGTPICLNTEERPQQYRDIKKAIANTATTLASVVPKGYVIKEIRLKASASITGVKIGTSSGGQQIVASTTAGTTATLATLVSTANDGYSETADQTIYVEHATAGQTLDVIIKMEKVGN